MINATAYIEKGRPCPACLTPQAPQPDSITNPVLRECSCGAQWRNVFRHGQLVGYDPKGSNHVR